MIVVLKRMFSKFKIINPVIDYPIIVLAMLNCLILFLIYLMEYYLLKIGIQTPNRFGAYNSVMGYVIGMIVLSGIIFSTIFLLLIRDIISFVTMKPDGGDPVTSLMIISLCIAFNVVVFREHLFYLLSLFRLM